MSVPWVLQWKQVTKVPEHQQPENVGTASQVEPTLEVHKLSDQTLEPLTQKKPRSEEPEVPTGGIGQQVEVDKVKGSEV